MVPTYRRVLCALGAVAALYWAAAPPLMLVPYIPLGPQIASNAQLVNSRPNGSATPGTVARLAILASASLRTQRKLHSLQKVQLQLGTATQHRLP